MPEVHLPHLEDETEPQQAPVPHKRRAHLLKLLLEVALISSGVFLGLMGEQWRENAHHRELAEESLRRFRTEITANRAEVERVRGYHVERSKELKAYYAAEPAARKNMGVHLSGTQPANFQRTAWELALATGSLAYIEPDLSYELSHIYTMQQSLADMSHGLLQAMYIQSPYEKVDSFLGAVAVYYDDATIMEPGLIEVYDNILPHLDQALGIKEKTPLPAATQPSASVQKQGSESH